MPPVINIIIYTFLFLVIAFLVIIFLLMQKKKRNQVQESLPLIEKGLLEWEDLVNNKFYLNKKRADDWRTQYYPIFKGISFNYKRIGLSSEILSKLEKLQSVIKHTEDLRKTYNENFVEKEKVAYKDFFGSLEDYPLDAQQQEAILNDEDNTLIIAGAGTGKTSTILGKVGYILEKGLAKPEELLLIAFTRAAADEMAERVSIKLGAEVKVKTFHSFGYEVIGRIEGAKPSLLFDGDERQVKQFLNKRLQAFVKDDTLMAKLTTFFSYLLIPEKPDSMFQSLDEYFKYIKSFQLLTLNGELVKSLEELKICNFLFLNQVPYEYEAKFEPEQRNPDYKIYKPDFYLPDYDIYIEHYGIDRDYNVPPFFSGRNGLSAKEVYKKGIDWKRDVHNRYDSNYIETYSYENKEGNLFKNLTQKLEEFDVVFSPLPGEEIYKKLEEHKYIPFFIDLVFTFLTLAKSNHVTLRELKKKARIQKDDRSMAFLEIFEILFNEYEELLKKRDEIDFNDMILKATGYVKKKKYLSSFKYIIIDEFQDMSVGRYKFIKALRDQNLNQKLYCVGDDWQSIFRFTGSDISITTQFAEYFGFTYQGKIETTYRFNDEVLKFTSNFIQENPAQIRKALKAKSKFLGTPFHVFEIVATQKEEKIKERKEKLYLALDKIKVLNDKRIAKEFSDAIMKDISNVQSVLNILKNRSNLTLPKVFIIGRYNHSKPKYFQQLKQDYSNLDIEFYTAHRSKGLTCDFAVLMDVVGGRYGFPTEIADDPILSLVLNEGDDFENAEERRLFYVATTRAKHEVCLITETFNRSKFVENLRSHLKLDKKHQPQTCKHCGALMVQREGQYGKFWGCTNYPMCTSTQKIYEEVTP